MVSVYHHPPAAIAESRPAICLTKHILRRELARPHFFIAPKDIALRMAALGEEPVGEADGLHCLAVIDGANLNAGRFFEIAKDRLGIFLVLSAVGDDGSDRLTPHETQNREQQAAQNCNRWYNPLPKLGGHLAPAEFVLRPVVIHLSFRGLVSHTDSRLLPSRRPARNLPWPSTHRALATNLFRRNI